jgi:hypothetical protein
MDLPSVQDLMTDGKEMLDLSLIGGHSGIGAKVDIPSVTIIDTEDVLTGGATPLDGSIIIVANEALLRWTAAPRDNANDIERLLLASRTPLMICSRTDAPPPSWFTFPTENQFPCVSLISMCFPSKAALPDCSGSESITL